MKFVPYPDKAQIEPIEVDSMLRGDNDRYLETGKVIAIGNKCKFLKVGDTVFFDSWGMRKTPEDENGKQYFVITDNSTFILGKYESRKKRV